MEEEQFTLPLITPLDPDGVDPNRKKFLLDFMKNTWLGSSSTWQIFSNFDRNKNRIHFLGIRTFLYDTDYDYLQQISYEEGMWLHKEIRISDFMGGLKGY